MGALPNRFFSPVEPVNAARFHGPFQNARHVHHRAKLTGISVHFREIFISIWKRGRLRIVTVGSRSRSRCEHERRVVPDPRGAVRFQCPAAGGNLPSLRSAAPA